MHSRQAYEYCYAQQLGELQPQLQRTACESPLPRETSSCSCASQEIGMRRQRSSSKCPQCGTQTSKSSSYCPRCGIGLTICKRCGSLNILYASFCHMCGETMTLSSTSNEVSKIIMWETIDLDALDEAVLAILRVRGGTISLSEASVALGISSEELAESIERLERRHQIEQSC